MQQLQLSTGKNAKADYHELQRRHDATFAGGAGEPAPRTSGTCRRPFKDEQQSFVLLNVANSRSCPRSLQPAVRVMGLFGSLAEAQAQVERVRQIDVTCSYRAVSTCAWSLMSLDENMPGQDQLAKIERLSKLHTDARVESKLEFDEHRAKLRGDKKPSYSYTAPNPCEEHVVARRTLEDGSEGTITTIVVPPKPSTTDTTLLLGDATNPAPSTTVDTSTDTITKDSTTSTDIVVQNPEPTLLNGTPVPPCPVMAHVSGQRYAVISILEDREGQTEPAVCVYAAFAQEDDAERYISQVAKRKVLDHDIACVDMYAWLFPHVLNNPNIDARYRHDELDRIMKSHRESQRQAEDYRAQCEELGMTPRVTEFIVDDPEDGKPLENWENATRQPFMQSRALHPVERNAELESTRGRGGAAAAASAPSPAIQVIQDSSPAEAKDVQKQDPPTPTSSSSRGGGVSESKG